MLFWPKKWEKKIFALGHYRIITALAGGGGGISIFRAI